MSDLQKQYRRHLNKKYQRLQGSPPPPAPLPPSHAHVAPAPPSPDSNRAPPPIGYSINGNDATGTPYYAQYPL